MFPVERTFSEWAESEYATTGVYAPQFAGDKADGMVSTCQDCHMKDVTGVGCSEGGAPTRSDLGLHDFTGGNTFIGDILPDFYPGVDTAALQAAKLRASDKGLDRDNVFQAGGLSLLRSAAICASARRSRARAVE
mgnify:CR=1 FL=1